MKRLASLAALFAAAAAVLAAPAATAGSEVFKCVDRAGHVTLTDQPCAAGSSSARLAADGSAAQGGSGAAGATGSSGPEPAAVVPAPQRHVLPEADLRHDSWKRPATARPAPLARDVATLKAARRMLLQETPRANLAVVD